MRDFVREIEDRTAFIRSVVASAGAGGIVFANSGGKDCVLTGILCKKACDNTLGLIMPCGSKRNYGSDKDDAEAIAGLYGISSRIIDLTAARDSLAAAVGAVADLTGTALANIAPRLRMNAIYAVALSENRLVAGTGNRSERYMGYFTKWGDGAYDFNPIADLTVTEVYGFLRYLRVPERIIAKAPSAGLFEGQTDEGEMGVTYASIDNFLLNGVTDEHDLTIIERYHRRNLHKTEKPPAYGISK